MSTTEDLWAIRMELKGQREAIAGMQAFNREQQGAAKSTTATGVAAERAEKKTSRLSRAYAALGKTGRWALGFLGVSGVFALKSAIDNTEELAKTTAGLTRNFNLHTNVASRWAAVAHAREIDSKALSMTFGTLSSRMVEAGRKGGTALTPFHQLGITQEEVAHGARDFEWGLLRVAQALGDLQGGAKRTTAAKALLGKGFQTLLPLFSEGTKGLKEQLHWADKYGVTLDGKTTDGLMAMVTAQRESRVAMLGLQVALTKALSPAIEEGQHAVQKFIEILNDPHLAADEKIHQIEELFTHLEEKVFHVAEKLLPIVADQWEHLGLRMVEALWDGFQNSSLMGKLVIGGWLLKSIGGLAVVEVLGGKIGKKLGGAILSKTSTAFMNRFPVLTIMMEDAFSGAGKLSGKAFTAGAIIGLAVGIPLLALEIEHRLPESTKGAFRRWAIGAGEDFVNGLIGVINSGIREINDALDKANIFSVLGVDAPNIGEVGGVNFHSDLERQEEEAHRRRQKGLIDGPGGKPVKPFNPKGSHRPGAHSLPSLPRLGALGLRGPRQPIVIPIKLEADGRQLAELTVTHVLDAESLA